MEDHSTNDIIQMQFYKTIFDQLVSLSNTFPSIPKNDEAARYLTIRKRYAVPIVLNELINLCLRNTDCEISKILENYSIEVKLKEEIIEAFTLLELQHTGQTSVLETKELSTVSNDDEKQILSTNFDVFGIDGAMLRNKANKLITSKHLEFLKKKLNQFVLVQSNHIVSFTFTKENYSPSEGISKVFEYITKIRRDSDSKRIQLEKQRLQRRRLLQLVFGQLMDYESRLESLVKKARMDDHSLSHLRFISVTIKAYLMKLMCLEKDVMNKTYTRTSIPRLLRIRETLREEETSVTKELDFVEQRLSAYENLPPKFHQLQREYSTLLNDIEFINKT